MTTTNSNVYQFKIILQDTEPTIWRRIQVPDKYTFWDLHVAIQDSMGWRDCHMHQFHVLNPKTGKEECISKQLANVFEGAISGETVKITQYFLSTNDKAYYEYDFGDGWMHEVVLENILQANEDVQYPQCIAGERACPPEDCGGVYCFTKHLKIISNPNHKKYKESMEYLGSDWNALDFDHKLVKFHDPTARLKMRF